MSLINDALKRASTPKTPPGHPAGTAPLQPVQDATRRNGPLPLILCIVGVGSLLIAGGLWLKSKGTPQTAVSPNNAPLSQAELNKIATPEPRASSPTTAAAPPTKAAPVATAEPAHPAPVESKAIVAATPPVQAVANSEPAEPVDAKPPAPSAPTIKLQAIYFRMKNPTAVINGRTMKIGDTAAGIHLLSIQRTSVEIEENGVRHHLTLN